MNKLHILSITIIVVAGMLMFLQSGESYLSIPPTIAFSNNTNVKLELGILNDIDETNVLTFNWISEFNENDIISFQQSCTDTGLGILFTDETVSPDTPSIIISIAQIGW